MTQISLPRRFGGAAQIVRLNWTRYAAAFAAIAFAAVISIAIPLPSWLAIVAAAGAGLAGFWTVSSVIISHLVYDRSPLRRWSWVRDALGGPPARWVNVHCGVDESTPTLRRLFPGSVGRSLDVFDAVEATEASILRARRERASQSLSERADFRRLPLADGSCDAALLLLSAHELRRHDARVALLRELRRALAPGGRVILAEHLRDAWNFLAFGPGVTHFHSRRTWLRATREAGFEVTREFNVTPFVTVFVLGRTPSP